MFEQDSGMLKAAKWTIASNVLQEVLSGLLVFILAIFLKPEQFGTVSLAYVYIVFIEVIIGFGFTTAIIQRKAIEEIHLSSVFWLNQISGLLLFFIAISLSGWCSEVNKMPQLQPILMALSFLIPLHSLSVVQIAILQRKMEFKRLALRTNSATALSGILGVVLAISGFGAWSLVFQHLAKGLSSTILLWKVSDWRPNLLFDRQALKSLSEFSCKSFIGQIGSFFQQQTDALFVGIVLGPAALGLYKLADRLVETTLRLLPRALQIVSLPHFSKLQDNLVDLNKAILLSLQLCCTFLFPVMGMLAGASPLVLRTLGEQWLGAASVLRILAIIGMSRAILMLLGPVLPALSRPGTSSINTWALAAANAACVALAAALTVNMETSVRLIVVASLRAAVFFLIFSPLVLFQVTRASGLSVLSFYKTIGPSILIAAVIAGVQWFVYAYFGFSFTKQRFLPLIIATFVGIITWLISLRLIDSSGFVLVKGICARLSRILMKTSTCDKTFQAGSANNPKLFVPKNL
jgi:O-antigen/teichoic acid export membrane protein